MAVEKKAEGKVCSDLQIQKNSNESKVKIKGEKPNL